MVDIYVGVYLRTMASPQERTPQEKETLVFPDQEEAREFAERVEGRITQEQQPGVDKRRDIIAEELANQFDAQGEGVDIVRHPWEHSQEEHQEVQDLVNLSFSKDLRAALKEAKASPNYPRNLDLFHDVLTGEMYKVMADGKVNKQSLTVSILLTLIVLVVSALLLIVAVVYFNLN